MSSTVIITPVNEIPSGAEPFLPPGCDQLCVVMEGNLMDLHEYIETTAELHPVRVTSVTAPALISSFIMNVLTLCQRRSVRVV